LLYDNATKVILLYVEDIKNGRNFIEAASKVTLRKQIIALKSGRTDAGARAVASPYRGYRGLGSNIQRRLRPNRNN
jgi:acyl-CoA synthetase (NDP forming)